MVLSHGDGHDGRRAARAAAEEHGLTDGRPEARATPTPSERGLRGISFEFGEELAKPARPYAVSPRARLGTRHEHDASTAAPDAAPKGQDEKLPGASERERERGSNVSVFCGLFTIGVPPSSPVEARPAAKLIGAKRASSLGCALAEMVADSGACCGERGGEAERVAN